MKYPDVIEAVQARDERLAEVGAAEVAIELRASVDVWLRVENGHIVSAEVIWLDAHAGDMSFAVVPARTAPI